MVSAWINSNSNEGGTCVADYDELSSDIVKEASTALFDLPEYEIRMDDEDDDFEEDEFGNDEDDELEEFEDEDIEEEEFEDLDEDEFLDDEGDDDFEDDDEF